MFSGSSSSGNAFQTTGFNTQQPSNTGMTVPSLFGNTFGQGGGSSLFGSTTSGQQPGAANSSTNLFGAPKPAQSGSLFNSGTTAAFGAQQANASFGSGGTSSGSSLFGSQLQKPGGLFGGGQQPALGQQGSSSSIFGQPPQQAASSSIFGNATNSPSTQSGGLFGQKPQPQQQPASLFGGGTAALSGSLSTSGVMGGAFQQQQNVVGTTIKFDALKSSDTMLSGGVPKAINTKHMCITAMKQYEGKSLEELRVEDYMAQRKSGSIGFAGSASSAPQPLSSFGTKQPQTGGLFGGATSNLGFPQVGQPATSAAVTTSTPNIFGNPAAQTNTLFGNKPGTSIFTQPAAQAAPVFPVAQPSATTNIFGNQNAGSGIFPLAQKPAFVQQPATGQLSAFGNTAVSVQQPTQGLFAKPTTTFLGGSNTLQPSTATFPSVSAAGSIFGTPQVPAAGGGLSLGGNQGFNMSTTSSTAVSPTSMNIAGIQQAILTAQLQALPYGDSPLLKMSTPLLKEGEKQMPTPPLGSLQARLNGTASNGSATRTSSVTSSSKQTPITARLPVAGASLNASGLNASFSYKPLISLPYAGYGAPLSLGTSPVNLPGRPSSVPPSDSASLRDSSFLSQASRDERRGDPYRPNSTLRAKALDVSILRRASQEAPAPSSTIAMVAEEHSAHSGPDTTTTIRSRSETRAHEVSVSERSQRLDESQRNGTESNNHQEFDTFNSQSTPPSMSSPTRTGESPRDVLRHDYYYKPSLEELQRNMVDGVAKVDAGLTIGRLGYGSVFWPGPFELHDLEALKDAVVFRAKVVVVYPDEAKKPPVGEELNRPAEVSLERIWPVSRQTKQPIKDPNEIRQLGFRDKLEKMCMSFGATFDDYIPGTGTWSFSVSHF